MANSNTVEIAFTTTGASRVVADSEKAGAAVRGVGESASTAAGGSALLNSNLASLGSVVLLGAIAVAGVAIDKIVGDLYSVNVEFGKLNAQLVTITGSQAGADAVFSRLEDFATKTPFQLSEVVNAFAKLKARGLDPSQKALTSYGDIASGMSKSLDQMIEAVGDAATFEFERLRDFGITAKSEGDKVSFTFKGITTTVAKESAAIEEYLIRLGQTNFGGGMNRQMEELGGTASNLGDSWDKLMHTIGDVGATAAAQGGMGLLTESLEGWSILIHDTNEEIKTTAEWMAAYSLGQISFWEWMTTGADEARGKLQRLKDEMAGLDPTAMLPSHDAGGSAERIAKIIAQAEKDAQTKAKAQAEAEKKAQKEYEQLLKDNPVQRAWGDIDQTGRLEADALINQRALDASVQARTEAEKLRVEINSLSVELAGQEAQLFAAAVLRSEMVIDAADSGVINEQRKADLLLQVESDYQTKLDALRTASVEKQVSDEVAKAERLGQLWWDSAQTYLGFAQNMTTMGVEYALADEQQRGEIAQRMLGTTIRFLTQSLAAYLFNKAKERVFAAAASASQIAAMGTVAMADMSIAAARATAWAAYYAAHAANPVGAAIYGASAAAMAGAAAGFGVAGAASAGIAAAGVSSNLVAAAGYAAAGIAVTAIGEGLAGKAEGTLSGNGKGIYGAGSPGSPVVTLPGMAPSAEQRPTQIIEVNFFGYTNASNPAELAREISAELRKASGDGY